MECKVDGCGRDAMYKEKQLCQMHYFRVMRNGITDTLPKTRKYRIQMPGAGYQRIYEPAHALSDKSGYVAEHRFMIYEKYGVNLPDCEICGAPTKWETCHVDHIDKDPTNNNINNLRPLCRPCNTFRDYPQRHTFKRNHSITYDGKTMTAKEWERQPEVNLVASSIVRRLNSGMSTHDALFAEKKTHNGKISIDNRPRKTKFKYERKNAIPVTIGIKTMSAEEWMRHPMCTVTSNTIISRVRGGVDHFEAVFTPARYKYTIPELEAIRNEYNRKAKELI
jgi:5-methylcytosine-specific restriction endonuclease McrA